LTLKLRLRVGRSDERQQRRNAMAYGNGTMIEKAPVYRDASVAVPAQDPALLRIMSRIQDATSRLVSLHGDGAALADRIFGAVPTPGGSDSTQAMPDGMIHHIDVSLDALHSLITECENDMRRLSAI
jgi:hypothetical protein